MEHKLFNQLVAADATDEEMAELYQDLRYVFDDPFDALIEEAVNERGCVCVPSVQAHKTFH